MEIEIRRGYYGFSGFLVEGIVFLLIFLGVFFITLFLPDSMVEQYDDIISLAAIIPAVAGAVLVEYVMERKYGVTQQLFVDFQEECCVLRKGRSEWNISYQDITSVVKVMVINRVFDEKGAYRVTIRRKGRRSITFWTTDQEYQEHRDFEDTQLYGLYLGLKSHGVRCC